MAAASSENVERRCENADCLVGELVSRIPKRKTPQFIVNPTIIEKPLLVNNFNSVFQVDGTSAKLSDITTQHNVGSNPNTIYRIIPNTHAHIVNYVVVDDDGEAMRKINASDPTTISKLLKSQVASAQKMLHKLMTEQGTMVSVSYNNKSGSVAVIKSAAGTPNTSTATTTIATATAKPTLAVATALTTSTTTPATIGISKLATKPTITTITPLKGASMTLLPTTTVAAAATAATTATATAALNKTFRLNSQIKVPRKILPKNASGSAKATVLPSPPKNINNNPMIKTVPLSQLQKPSVFQNRPFTTTAPRSSMTTTSKTIATEGINSGTVLLPPQSFSSSSSTISATSSIDYVPTETPIIVKTHEEKETTMEEMKKELDDLRRTVVALAARQPVKTTAETAAVTVGAKTTSTTLQPRAKRARLEK